MEAVPSPLPDTDSERDWSELPVDALSAIFTKLGTVEILMGASFVCHSWLAASKSPELWRFVDMTRHKVIFSKRTGILCAMAKAAIDRSDGQIESFWAQKFVTGELLDYIVRRKTIFFLRIANSGETDAYEHPDHPHLKRLRVHMHYFDQDELENEMIEHVLEEGGEVFEEPFEQREARRNADAFAIAENMHELRLLQIAGHNLTEKGVRAILDGCPHLECLDLSSCHDIYVDGQLQARFAMIKHVRLPWQRSHDGDCPDLRAIGERVTMADLFRGLARSLLEKMEMGDGTYGDD